MDVELATARRIAERVTLTLDLRWEVEAIALCRMRT
jgi:hypothetical protein